MDRRIVLAGLAAAVIATPALAQQSNSSSTMSSGSAGATSAQGAMSAQMGQAEMQHMQQTMMLGMVALETSRMAQEKARNADLKQFAQFEVQEQQTLSEILRGMMDPSATAATGSTATQSNTTMASNAAGGMNVQMDAKSREMVQKLSQASGAEFDREYLQGQIQGHRDLLQVQERYISSNSQNREHMNIAKMARTQIREHIALLEDMQKNMK